MPDLDFRVLIATAAAAFAQNVWSRSGAHLTWESMCLSSGAAILAARRRRRRRSDAPSGHDQLGKVLAQFRELMAARMHRRPSSSPLPL